MEINEAMFKMLSRIGSRATFGMAAIELASLVDDLIILTGDTSTSAGLQRFKSSFPDKFLDVGISEQNMIGIAAGLASEGTTVFTSTFARRQRVGTCTHEHKRIVIGYPTAPFRGPSGCEAYCNNHVSTGLQMAVDR